MEAMDETQFNEIQEKLYSMLCAVQLEGGKSLNTIQIAEDERDNKLLSGADLRNPSKIKDYSKLYGLDEFAEYVIREAKKEIKEKDDLLKKLGKIDEIFDEAAKEITTILGGLKEKFKEMIVPSSVCSRFCEKLKTGELNDQEVLKTEMNLICRKLHIYQQINSEQDTEKLQKLLETKINKIKHLLEPTQKEFDRIRPLRGLTFLPTGFNQIWRSKPLSSPPHNDYRGISASPNGDFVLGMSKGEVVKIDPLTGEKIGDFTFDVGSSTTHSGVCVSPNGNNFAVHSNNKCLYICDVDGKTQFRIPDHPSTIFSSCWIGESNVAVGYSSGELNVYSSLDGKKTYGFKPYTRGIYSLAGLDDDLFVGTDNGGLSLYNLNGTRVWGSDQYHSSQIGAMSISWDKTKLATVAYDKRAKILNILKKEVVLTFTMTGNGFGVAWAPGDFFLVILASGQGLLLVDETGKTCATQPITSAGVKGLAPLWKFGMVVVSDDQGGFITYGLN